MPIHIPRRMQLDQRDGEHVFLWIDKETGVEEATSAIRSRRTELVDLAAATGNSLLANEKGDPLAALMHVLAQQFLDCFALPPPAKSQANDAEH
jgi:hypothetical protein